MVWLGSHLVLAAALAGGAQAAEGAVQSFDVPAGASLPEALRDVALATGRNLIVSADLVRGRRAPALKGAYTADDAVAILLAGSGLKVTLVGDALVIVPAAEEQAEDRSRDIIVTGSQIRGRAAAGSAVISIDRDTIDRSGLATTQQLLQAVPQNFGGGPNEATSGFSNRDNASLNQTYGSSINLRGLGSSSTLVLLDGTRPPLGGATGIFADLSLIPSSVIARIEVLPDGASAIYGSDAVAGVVNIITRRKFEGAETRVRIGTADGDRSDLQLGQLLGTRWSSGGVALAYEFQAAERLRAADRRFATEDLRAFGGPDLRQPYANPSTISAGGRFFPIPPGQDGRSLTPAQLQPGAANVGDQWRFVDLLPEQQRHAALMQIEQALTDNLRIEVDGFFGHRRYDRRIYPSVTNAPRVVPASNPFEVNPLGTGGPVTVLYSFQRDLGPVRSRGTARVVGGTAGLTWSPGSWSVQLRGSAAWSAERARLLNLVNVTRLNAALADSDPATAYNLFSDGPSTNPATIDKVRGSLTSLFRSSLRSLVVRADGPLLTLPGGDIRVALGAEHRREHVTSPPGVDDSFLASPRAIRLDGLPGPRKINAAFAELSIPLVGPDAELPLARRIDLSLAGRVEDYSDFGTTTNPKLGLRWEAMDGVALRGTYGTSFRAPGFNDLRRGPAVDLIFAIGLTDPLSPTGTTNTVVLRGNKPGLGPERATTWTAGIDLAPLFAPGLRVSIGWYDIRYRDRIASPAAELLSFLSAGERFAAITNRSPAAADIAAFYADPTFRNFFNVSQASIRAVVDARTQNLASVRQSGIDLDASYRFRLLGGDLGLGLTGTIITRLDQKLTASAQPVSLVGRLGNPVRSRFRASAFWTNQSWTLAGFANRISGYSNTTQTPAQPVASWTTLDLSLGYTIPSTIRGLGGTRLALSATNILDRAPPYVQNNSGLFTVGYDPDLADPLGRVVALQVVKSW
jgi:outer membrane receptor protein involved in Fe transport